MNPSEEKTIFSWLHLSDIHFLHGDIHNQTDQEMILNALHTEIQKVTSSSSSVPRPDAVFITGDIAYSGADIKVDEYKTAEGWLLRIIGTLGLGPESVYIVPGNHDVQRSVAENDDDISMLIESLRDSRRSLVWALSNEKQCTRLASRFHNYIEFCSRCTSTYQDLPSKPEALFWHRTIPSRTGFTIRLIGLNTALLSQDDADEGKLGLSLLQVKGVSDLTDSPNQLAIAMSHHPLTCLRDGLETERWLRKKVQIHLCGHMHDPDSISYISGAGTGLIRVQAGALHEGLDDNTSSSCFNYAAIVVKTDGNVVLRIWNRLWSQKNKDFRDDPDCHPVDTLFAEHPLPVQYASGNIAKLNQDPSSANEPSKHKTIFERRKEFISDSPPVIDVWVGRKSELSLLDCFESGVIAVTGIGGQGKSAFASKYLEQWCCANPDCFWDWRDCREQQEQFHSKLVSIIENVSEGQMLGSQLEGVRSKDLARAFFELIADSRGLIVLDNVDQYVDLSAGKFTLGVSDFVEAALQSKHNLTILITCRPSINYASPRFREIHLKGISRDEAVELFGLRGVGLDEQGYTSPVLRIHQLTDGHPLWLNLIATQVAKKLATCEGIIEGLEHGAVDDRAKTMMRAVLKSLKPKQVTILRYMAEFARPQDIDWIYDCVRKDIKSWNQFHREFQSLQTLNLVIETHGVRDLREFDLHPIVRNFIRNEFFSRRERDLILDRVLCVLESFINKYDAQATTAFTPINLLESLVDKAELALRKDDFKTAITTLFVVGKKLVLRGMPSELFRVGELVLEKCHGECEHLIDFDDFHSLNRLLAHTYAEYGREDRALKHVERYTSFVPKDTAYFVSVCDVRCYTDWLLGHYKDAISWGREGQRIKKDSGVDTRFDTSHTLALALRDSGDIDSALSIFLDGATVDEVITSGNLSVDKGAEYFGNIGRCLQLQGAMDQALECLIKSARILEADVKEDQNATLNKGYACLWIGEILETRGDYSNAYLFYLRAEIAWMQRAPFKVEEPRSRLRKVFNSQGLPNLNMTETGVERAVKKWIQGYKSNYS